MGSYEEAVEVLDRELQLLLGVFDEMSEDEWTKPTMLQPLDPNLKHWTVFELAGHFDISIGLTWMLLEDPKDGQVGRDRVSFFIFPRSEVAPVVYDYAYTMVEGKTPSDMPGVLRATFTRVIDGARANPPVSSFRVASSKRSSTASTSPTRWGETRSPAPPRWRSRPGSWTRSSPAAPSRVGRQTSPTISRGCGPRQDALHMTTPASR